MQHDYATISENYEARQYFLNRLLLEHLLVDEVKSTYKFQDCLKEEVKTVKHTLDLMNLKNKYQKVEDEVRFLQNLKAKK